MKLFDLIWMVIINGSLIGWVTTAKDFVSWTIATGIGILTIIYLNWKRKKEKLEYLKLKEELKEKDGEI